MTRRPYRIWYARHGARTEGETMTTMYERACRVVDAAGQAGGIDEVRRIADRGWPGGEVDGQPASTELLAAIRDRARHIVDEVDEVQS